MALEFHDITISAKTCELIFGFLVGLFAYITICAIIHLIVGSIKIHKSKKKQKSLQKEIDELKERQRLILLDHIWQTLIDDIDNIKYLYTDTKERMMMFAYGGKQTFKDCRYHIWITDIDHTTGETLLMPTARVSLQSDQSCVLSGVNKFYAELLANKLMSKVWEEKYPNKPEPEVIGLDDFKDDFILLQNKIDFIL